MRPVNLLYILHFLKSNSSTHVLLETQKNTDFSFYWLWVLFKILVLILKLSHEKIKIQVYEVHVYSFVFDLQYNRKYQYLLTLYCELQSFIDLTKDTQSPSCPATNSSLQHQPYPSGPPTNTPLLWQPC